MDNKSTLSIDDIKSKAQKKKLLGAKVGDTIELKTKGLFAWQTIEKEFELIEGSFELTMNVLGNEFNLNWMEFEFIGELSHNDISPTCLTLYPNPSKGKIFIQSEKPIDFIEIYSINGKQIDLLLIDNKINFSIEPKLPKGLYLLRFNKLAIKKLLIK